MMIQKHGPFTHTLFAVCIALFALPICVQAAGKDWKAPAAAAAKKNPVPADEKSVTEGRRTYIRECASCHGRTGKGDGTRAKELKTPPGDLTSAKVAGESDGELFWKITTGNEPMESYQTKLTDQQRWELVNYIRNLGGKQTTAKEGKTTGTK